MARKSTAVSTNGSLRVAAPASTSRLEGIATQPAPATASSTLPTHTISSKRTNESKTTHHNSHSDTSSTAEFRQLLAEIRANPEASIARDDVQGNWKLVSVVVEAGLGPVIRGARKSGDALVTTGARDRSEDHDASSLAKASLEVLQYVLQRAPEVLMYSGETTDVLPGNATRRSTLAVPSSQDPACTWLLPKLLQLLEAESRIEDPELLQQVEKTISMLASSSYRFPERWPEATNLLKFCQDCLEDLIVALERQSSTVTTDKKFTVVVPSPTTRQRFCNDAEPQSVVQRAHDLVRIHNPASAYRIALRLISALSPATYVEGHRIESFLPHLDEWIVLCVQRLWTAYQNQLHPANSSSDDRQALALLLNMLKSLINLMIDGRREPQSLLTTVHTLMPILNRILQRPWIYENDYDLQIALEKAVSSVAKASLTTAVVAKDACETLMPTLQMSLANESEVQTLGLDQKSSMMDSLELLSRLQTSSNDANYAQQIDLTDDPSPPPAKRQRRLAPSKSSDPSVLPICKQVLRNLCSLIHVSEDTSVQAIPSLALEAFETATDDQKDEILDFISAIPCVGCHQVEPRIDAETDVIGRLQSVLPCSCDDDATVVDSFWNEEEWVAWDRTLMLLAKSSAVASSTSRRTQLMLALRALAYHTTRPSSLNLSSSTLGKWCLQCLRSSVRELRVLAGQTLPMFLRSNTNNREEVVRSNRIIALEFLKSLSDQDNPRLTETTIQAFGQVARACGDEELNLILLRLVDYLGYSNTLICSIAYVELMDLAQYRSGSTEELFRPFWRSIAPHVVKDLLSRPQKVQQLTDLLSISVGQFLMQTQSDTVPYLVLWKRKDILERIASAAGASATSWSMCMLPHNLAPTVALVFAQGSDNHERRLHDLLHNINPNFIREDVQPLLKLHPIPVICELLKAAGDGDGEYKMKIHNAIHSFTRLVADRRVHTRGSADDRPMTTQYLESQALGIMTSLSDEIDNIRTALPAFEKKRCLRGVEELITLAEDGVVVALPQISACLQAALETDDMRDAAFSTWATLLSTLQGDEELESLVDQTFAVIVRHWKDFSEQTRQLAHETVAALLKNHSALIRENVALIPSLGKITLMAKFESEINRLKAQYDVSHQFQAFAKRCQNESSLVCLQALRELLPFLEERQQYLHEAAVSEQPNPVLPELVRALLDACVRFGETSDETSSLCTQCLGIIGCLDPNRTETVKATPQIVVLSNFDQADEAIGFITFMFEHILVNAFHSVSNPRAQSFLAYVMQELLKFCGYTKEAVYPTRLQSSQADDMHQRWIQMPEKIRTSLTPLLSSRYVLTTPIQRRPGDQKYPIYEPGVDHAVWLRSFVSDLLSWAKGDNAKRIFMVLSRIIRSNDISIAGFLLPFAVANVVIGGTEEETNIIQQELLTILGASTTASNPAEAEIIRLCSQNVFQCLDYLSQWLQMKRREMANSMSAVTKSGKGLSELEELSTRAQLKSVERITLGIPAELIARRAVECKSYSRALFHWEQYIRQQRSLHPKASETGELDPLYQRLQDIYAQIDEPDGIEGIASQLHSLDPSHQILEHEKAGRWTTAQSWYELQLQDDPNNANLQGSLLRCLKQSGQYDMALNQALAFGDNLRSIESLAVTAESAWQSERWDDLRRIFSAQESDSSSNFNLSIGSALLALQDKDFEIAAQTISASRASIAKTLSATTTASLQGCHEQLLKLHTLYEVEVLSGLKTLSIAEDSDMRTTLDRRLNVLGAFLQEKQYILGIRRAAMHFSKTLFESRDFASSWMASAKLARKGNALQTSYKSVLQASNLGDEAAKIEHARLLWKDGQHRKAIQSLEGAISSNAFKTQPTVLVPDASGAYPPPDKPKSKDLLTARAQLLLAKWLDAAGHTQSSIINAKYQLATNSFPTWEKGQYYLGSYYNKLLEAEKVLPPAKQSFSFLQGETAKLVLESYLRSLSYGTKYLFQTLPKLLTLWLELGENIDAPISPEVSDEVRNHVKGGRMKMLDTMNRQIKKYLDRIPPYVFYTALAQMITRVTHPNQKVYHVLESVILRVASAYPQQSLWSLFAVVKSATSARAARGMSILNKLKDKNRNVRLEGLTVELRTLVTQGQRLSDQLVHACDANIEGRATLVSLTKDMGFNPKVAPCPLVIPLEKTLAASLPTTALGEAAVGQSLKAHRAFPRDPITISSISDEVLVLSSLQRPRKLTVRGTDGNKYGLLCKPRDDLRKDQRLMEFNAMINRALKKDASASKRQLYIRTYAVTPLNEACGLIEWVEGLVPLRDILLKLYRQRGVKSDFAAVRDLLNDAVASSDPGAIFTKKILSQYPPILHEYFTELYPEPSTWFAARLRYARSCAVTSMVGWVLGLGDRHGENVLLEQRSGGVFHVDFNCLFEKGLTFEKPEVVPFRLTHNMVDACGVSGVEGPWRRCAELAMACMRATEDALLTIVETFVYDPTADFVGAGGAAGGAGRAHATTAVATTARKRGRPGVPETPREVLESVRAKLGGLLRGESVPLSGEGVVDALVRQATDANNLAAMYIGWCAFL